MSFGDCQPAPGLPGFFGSEALDPLAADGVGRAFGQAQVESAHSIGVGLHGGHERAAYEDTFGAPAPLMHPRVNQLTAKYPANWSTGAPGLTISFGANGATANHCGFPGRMPRRRRAAGRPLIGVLV
jgi:hypothetical protein